jgi:uncharacterized protein (DUF433 family)
MWRIGSRIPAESAGAKASNRRSTRMHDLRSGRAERGVFHRQVEECERLGVVSVDVLDREMFSEAEAARLLRLPQNTLHYWLDGGRQRGRTYKQVVRIEPRGGRTSVTWAEFIEAGLLRQYRRTHRIAMPQLRSFVDELREQFAVPYPLAHHRPFVGSHRQLVLRAQEAADLDGEYCLVAIASGQLILTHPAEAFVERVTWDHDVAAAWRPHDDERSPVRMNPELRFGRPAIKGISTEVLWEHAESGEDVEETAEAFDLEPDDVRWALAYETSLRAA